LKGYNKEAMGEEDAKDPPTQLEKKIIRQIEYYFGDKNLPRDKFLQEKIHQDNGWVTLECLTTFNRLKSLSTDFDEIFKALEKSKSGLLELDTTNKKIRRNLEKAVPSRIDHEANRLAKLKTLYVKGFPTEYTLDNIEEFFEGKGDVIFIKMRRDDTSKFKGSIFVEFATQEMANNFLQQDLAIDESVLEKMTREDYYKKKDEEKKAGKGKGKQNEGDKEETEDKDAFVAGCVIHFKGAGEGTSREDLKALFGGTYDIKWVDFNRNDTEGFIQFKEEGTAQKAIDTLKEANGGKVMINGVEATLRVVEGEEETKYWEKSKKDRQTMRQKKASKGNRNRGNKRSRQETSSNVKNGGTKPKGSGQHKRFDNDDNDDVKEEKEEIKEDTNKEVNEGEPEAKKVKAE